MWKSIEAARGLTNQGHCRSIDVGFQCFSLKGARLTERKKIFISYATADSRVAEELRQALEGQGFPIWTDERNLRGGEKLLPEIKDAIKEARQVLLVLSPNTVNSVCVREEIKLAVRLERKRMGKRYRVIPLLLPGIEATAVGTWFGKQPTKAKIEFTPGRVSRALPRILAALGEPVASQSRPSEAVVAEPIEELRLRLTDLSIEEKEDNLRVSAQATLTYCPADPAARNVESRAYRFHAPLGPFEAEELHWYLERYHIWPMGLFRERAGRIEEQLPVWGESLFKASVGAESAAAPLIQWSTTTDEGAERRFSVMLDPEPPEGTDNVEAASYRQAASALLSLPWELLHDGRGFLFAGARPVRVRRRLVSHDFQPPPTKAPPIRVLLVTPRPEDKTVDYVDHRGSALALVDVLETMGEMAKLSLLSPPTFPSLKKALRDANKSGEPFTVVHFNGHGLFDKELGLGGLCFEDPDDTNKLEMRRSQIVWAEKLGQQLRDYRIPLVFLEACQSAQSEKAPTASVAAQMLNVGVCSVVAMSHTVLVETARRFTEAFYAELAMGSRIGKAMLVGQQALYENTSRGNVMGAGKLHLQDWFVPVLFQERQDLQLVDETQSRVVRQLQWRQRRLALGGLPNTPSHGFLGRSRELLALERLLVDEPYAVIGGMGGEGKTALGIELAHWLARIGRFKRVAWVCIDHTHEARSVLDTLGNQLVPGGNYSVSAYKDVDDAMKPVEHALRDCPTLVLLDNFESLMGEGNDCGVPVEGVLGLCSKLLEADDRTRLVFTSREPLPEPFARGRHRVELGPLSKHDAIKLVGQVLHDAGKTLPEADADRTPEEIDSLVEAVGCHARALVVLAPELASSGVKATTEVLHELMGRLHEVHPDNREHSLFASVELSLRRLLPEARGRIRALSVFHFGACPLVLAGVLGNDLDAARQVITDLINVGLGEDVGGGYLRFDPALPAYLRTELAPADLEQFEQVWAEETVGLSKMLYEATVENAELQAYLTRLETPNLMALLEHLEKHASRPEVARYAGRLELLLNLFHPSNALTRIQAVHQGACDEIDGWTGDVFNAQILSIGRLLADGKAKEAVEAARDLLQRCHVEGEEAYEDAAYDLALAHEQLGYALIRSGEDAKALPHLEEAMRRFRALANEGHVNAERMTPKVIHDLGTCLKALLKLDQAAKAFRESVERAEKNNDHRTIALNKLELGQLALLRGGYEESLDLHRGALDFFMSLGEPVMVATTRHRIAMVYAKLRQHDDAEQEYRQALALRVRVGDRKGEAETLGELGRLCLAMERFVEGVDFSSLSRDIYIELDNRLGEGCQRSNCGASMSKLGRTDEARHELEQALECFEGYGHAAEPWITWEHLYELERAAGNAAAAATARTMAIEVFTACRRDGGQSDYPSGWLCGLVTDVFTKGTTDDVTDVLAVLKEVSETSHPNKALIDKLRAVLEGSRDPTMADDPELPFDASVELKLLLERFAALEVELE